VSDTHLCNFCTLKDIKRRHKSVKLVHEGSGWIAVMADGERVATFMALTEYCVC